MELPSAPIVTGEIAGRTFLQSGLENIFRIDEIERGGIQLVSHRQSNCAHAREEVHSAAGPIKEALLFIEHDSRLESLISGPHPSGIEKHMRSPRGAKTRKR